MRALALHGVTGAVRQQLAQAAAVARMAEAGLGVGVLPMHAARRVRQRAGALHPARAGHVAHDHARAAPEPRVARERGERVVALRRVARRILLIAASQAIEA